MQVNLAIKDGKESKQQHIQNLENLSSVLTLQHICQHTDTITWQQPQQAAPVWGLLGEEWGATPQSWQG